MLEWMIKDADPAVGYRKELVPYAPYYVISTDTFMSGWGHAKGLTNRCIVPCRDLEEAKRVLRYVSPDPIRDGLELSIRCRTIRDPGIVIYLTGSRRPGSTTKP